MTPASPSDTILTSVIVGKSGVIPVEERFALPLQLLLMSSIPTHPNWYGFPGTFWAVASQTAGLAR